MPPQTHQVPSRRTADSTPNALQLYFGYSMSWGFFSFFFLFKKHVKNVIDLYKDRRVVGGNGWYSEPQSVSFFTLARLAVHCDPR